MGWVATAMWCGRARRSIRAMTTTTTTPEPVARARPSLFRYWLVVAGLICAATTVYLLSGYVPPDPGEARVPTTGGLHYAVLLVHIGTGAVALLLGPWQFAPWIRSRHPRVHRTIGRVYLAAGVVPSAVTGVPVALMSAYGPVTSAAFTLLAVSWLITGIAAYRAVRQGRYAAHREWMIRNFALTLSAITFRSWLGLLIMALLPRLDTTYGGDFEALFRDAYGTGAWLSWVPSLLVAEAYLRLRRRPLRSSPDAVGSAP